MPSLGEYIKSKREEAGLSLRKFAAKCDLSHSYIDGLEKGINPKTDKPMRPNLETLEKLARGLGMTREALMVATGYSPTPPTAVIVTDYSKPYEGSINSGRPGSLIYEEEPSGYSKLLAPFADPELLDFWEELNGRQDLQRLCKKIRSLSPEGVQRVVRYINMVEEEDVEGK